MEEESTRVCVTGAAGYIGSWLVSKLLQRGYTVHATLRNLGDELKVALLKGLARGAEHRLLLFQADLYNSEEFEPAIRGCQYVFLVATPKQHYADSTKYSDTTEAAVAAVRNILRSCRRSGSVKRVIYTGSVTASSPLKEDGTGFKDFIDESCWTSLHLPFAHCEDFVKDYTCSKTQSEKALLDFNHAEENDSGIEVVSLVCGQVGGETLLPYTPHSVQVLASPLIGNLSFYEPLKFLQSLLGSIPIVHVDDVCEAHVFCMEKPSLSGRFLCACSYPVMQEILDYYEQKYPEMNVIKELVVSETGIKPRSHKLMDSGFKYAYGMSQILDDSVKCLKRIGGL